MSVSGHKGNRELHWKSPRVFQKSKVRRLEQTRHRAAPRPVASSSPLSLRLPVPFLITRGKSLIGPAWG